MSKITSIAWGRIRRHGKIRMRHALWLGAGAVVSAMAVGAAAQDSQRGAVEHFIGTMIRQTATVCPLTSPGDQAALDLCRSALYGDSAFRRGLAPVVLWGRPSPDGRRLRDTNLTQFAPDVLSGLYMPLFMFTGDYEIGFDPTERLYRARVPALFRNALDPGQYPYPFWHDAKKWADYQAANEVTFWIDPTKVKVVIMQFSARGKPDPRLTSAPYTQPAFDGKWMWTDAKGQSQPQPALFVGLMRRTNPYLGQLDSTFRELAGELRKGSCHECHSPDNYTGMKRLVLMQTPTHAAGEIKRMMRAVREDKMPLDDAGLYKEMDPAIKAALLKYGGAFELVVDAARDWEAKNP
ncbi:MAG TPA: hypothetical protein VEW27_13825 [Methylomirabilota bacterium]|nr:hypothetical protein [Methylomirabilota bacterium]